MNTTELMIVGVTHLGRREDAEPQSVLDPVVERIVGWSPDAIAVEVLPGNVVSNLDRLGGPYDGLRPGGFPHAVSCQRIGASVRDLNVWQARTLAQDEKAELADRVVAWCLAYEPYNALLLCGGRPDEIDGLLPEFVDALTALRDVGSEVWRIGAQAALRLGHRQVHPFDDHSHWGTFADVPDAEFEALMDAARPIAMAHPFMRGNAHAEAEAVASGDMWTLWQDLNTPERVAQVEQLESRLWLDLADEHPLARRQLAGWLTRNLLMAAQLRSVTGKFAGGRVIAVVGHAHKGPLEAALRNEQFDLQVVDVSNLG